MIVLFTDFGPFGPYLGQVRCVLEKEAPGVTVIDLLNDAPGFGGPEPKASAYLLASLAGEFPKGSVFLGIVDPGVGGPRKPVVVEADERFFIGPDNGLFELVIRRAKDWRWWPILWRPERLSATFHGRDLFAPVAARLARGERPEAKAGDPSSIRRPDWPDDLAQIIYVDHFGNCVSGLREGAVASDARLVVGGRRLERATTFSDRKPGQAFWFVNSNRLIEIAVNRGRADAGLGLKIGDPIELE
jgi:S-adenosylmethionine hydrolase